MPSVRLGQLPPEHCRKVAADRQSAPDAMVRRLTSDLDWIAMKALEKDRNRRYQTVESLRDDIQRHLKHEPVSVIGSLGDSMHMISLSFLYRETFWKPKSYRLLGQVASAHAIRGDRMEVMDTAAWMECYKELQAMRLDDARDELQRAAGTGQSQSD